jgi:hypothetical protein
MASTYLSKTFSSTTDAQRRTYTISFWIKRSALGTGSGNHDEILSAYGTTQFGFRFQQDNALDVFDYDGGSNQYVMRRTTNRKFRDVNAWYHIVLAVDTTQSTASDRVKLYINGVQETSFSASNNPSQNYTGTYNKNCLHHIASKAWGNSGNGSDQYRGLMSHFNSVAGTAYDASYFGETDSTTGEWKIKTSPSVTYGTNGFFILKDGNSVTDQSGNSNNWTVSGGTLTKTEDCPSNVFCTINPLTQEHTNNSIGYSSGNTNIFFDQTGQWWHTTSTLGAITGKYYAECKIDAVGGEASLGVISSDTACANQGTGDYMGKEVDSIGYLNNGRTMKANSEQQTGLTALSSGTIVGIAMDLDNNTVQFYINGSTSGNTVSLTADKFYLFGCSGYSDTRFYWNFGNGYFNTTAVSSAGTNASGNGIFEYDVPSGYTALSTKGLNL